MAPTTLVAIKISCTYAVIAAATEGAVIASNMRGRSFPPSLHTAATIGSVELARIVFGV